MSEQATTEETGYKLKSIKNTYLFESLYSSYKCNVMWDSEIVASVCIILCVIVWISVKFLQDANQLFEQKKKIENKLCG